MYSRSTSVQVLIGLACACALVFSGFLHALIPHHHSASHSHEKSEAASIWTLLHQAIQHEQKKSAVVVSEMIAILSIVFGIALSLPLLAAAAPETLSLDPHSGRILRRGIAPYRAFR